MKPKVSVFMRVYNKEKYLAQAIESVLGQSYANYELLLIDHESTDSSLEIIQSYASKYSACRVIQRPRTDRLPDLCNIALEAARGCYIACLDADDLAEPHRVEEQHGFLDRHANIGLVGSYARLIDDSGGQLQVWRAPEDHESLCSHLLFQSCFAHSSTMARVDLVRQIGGYNSKMIYAHDYDLFRRLRRITRVHCIPQELVHHRFGPNSIRSNHMKKQCEYALRVSTQIIKEQLGQRRLDEKSYMRFWRTMFMMEDSRCLRRSDIYSLRPLWDLILSNPHHRIVWIPRIRDFACQLVRVGAVIQGVALLAVLNEGYLRGKAVGPLIRALPLHVPGEVRRLWYFAKSRIKTSKKSLFRSLGNGKSQAVTR